MEQTYYKARNTLIEMMKDRGYQFGDSGLDSLYIAFEEFGELFRNDEMDLPGITTKDGFPVYVRIVYNVEDIKDRRNLFDKNKPDNSILAPVAKFYSLNFGDINDLAELHKRVHIILVYRAPKKDKDARYDISLETQHLDDPNTEAFPVHKLTFNVTKHIMVRKHTLLSEDERKQVLDRYNASRPMLSKICLDDPVNLYFNGRPGDIYKIDQPGYKPTYRVVVPRPLPRKKK